MLRILAGAAVGPLLVCLQELHGPSANGKPADVAGLGSLDLDPARDRHDCPSDEEIALGEIDVFPVEPGNLPSTTASPGDDGHERAPVKILGQEGLNDLAHVV